MKSYKKIKNYTPKKFKRTVGISKDDFLNLCDKAEERIEKEKEQNRLKKRGLKDSEMSLRDRILLTLYYLRHHPIFQNLADVFNIQPTHKLKIR